MSHQVLRVALQALPRQEQNRMPTTLLVSLTSRSQLAEANQRLVLMLMYCEAANALMEGPRCKSLLPIRRQLQHRGQALLPMRRFSSTSVMHRHRRHRLVVQLSANLPPPAHLPDTIPLSQTRP